MITDSSTAAIAMAETATLNLTADQRKSIRRMLGSIKYAEIVKRVGCSIEHLHQYAKTFRDDPDYIEEQRQQEAALQANLAAWKAEAAERQKQEVERLEALMSKYESVTTAELDQQISVLKQQLAELSEVSNTRKAAIAAEQHRAAIRQLAASIIDKAKAANLNGDAINDLIRKAVQENRPLWYDRARKLHADAHAETGGHCDSRNDDCWDWDDAYDGAQKEVRHELDEEISRQGLA